MKIHLSPDEVKQACLLLLAYTPAILPPPQIPVFGEVEFEFTDSQFGESFTGVSVEVVNDTLFEEMPCEKN